MPGTWLPATASAVSASTPKMLLSQAEANPWPAARCNSSRSAVIGLGPDGSSSDTPILIVRLPRLDRWTRLFCCPHLRFARLPVNGGGRLTRVRHRHLRGQPRVVGDEQPVHFHTAAPAQLMYQGKHGWRHRLPGYALLAYPADCLGDDLLQVRGRVR